MEPAPEFVVEFSYGNVFKRLDDWSADGEMGIINALLLVYITYHILQLHNSTQLNSTENYGRRCLTPLSPHHNYILS